MADAISLFNAIGGSAAFERLVDAFYAGVERDPLLRPMYPDDLNESRRRLSRYLIQFFGGPQDYAEERLRPRLPLRHLAFSIDARARDAWIRHMSDALDALDLPADTREQLQRYFEGTATSFVNTSC
jgi:hemoglobin